MGKEAKSVGPGVPVLGPLVRILFGRRVGPLLAIVAVIATIAVVTVTAVTIIDVIVVIAAVTFIVAIAVVGTTVAAEVGAHAFGLIFPILTFRNGLAWLHWQKNFLNEPSLRRPGFSIRRVLF